LIDRLISTEKNVLSVVSLRDAWRVEAGRTVVRVRLVAAGS